MDLTDELTGYGRWLSSRGTSPNTQKAYLSDVRDYLEFQKVTKAELNLESLRAWLYKQSEAGSTKSTLARSTTRRPSSKRAGDVRLEGIVEGIFFSFSMLLS